MGITRKFKNEHGLWVKDHIETASDRRANERIRRRGIREPVGTALANRIEGLIGVKSGKDCNCKTLAKHMDSWGIAGCEKRRAHIIATLVNHRDVLSAALKSEGHWIMAAAAEHAPDVALSIGAGRLLDLAIADIREGRVTPIKPATRRQNKNDVATGRRPSRRSGRYQRQSKVLYDKAMASPKPHRDPFTADPVFHFGAHLWPIVGHWEAHVNEWNKLAKQITGRCIVGVAECTGCGTSTTAEVIAKLSDRFEVFTVPNTAEGENPTFMELLKRMPTGENDIFLYAHGKGVKPATRVSAAVKVWISVMYATVIFNHHEIVRRMAQGYKTFGSLRAFGSAPLSPAHSWHYAGTFFAVRSKHLHNVKPVKPGYGGVEAWPGDNFPANEAWCEFGDNRPIMSHYSDQEMCSGVIEGAIKELQSRYAKRHCHRKLIAVTTCNLHGSEEIRKDIEVTLDSIALHCASDVLVVDDGSPIEYQEYVHDLCKHRGFRFMTSEVNGGISHAKNLCLSAFLEDPRYEYLIMLDDDVKVVSDEFESTYTTAMERAGVGILSWHDPAYTGSPAEPNGELVASERTCGCCVVASRECAIETGFYEVMPGKWGREHWEYYQRAAVKFGKPNVYFDVPNSHSLIALVSNASVFTHQEKLESNELNRIYLGADQ
jgi:hypothetical protein